MLTNVETQSNVKSQVIVGELVTKKEVFGHFIGGIGQNIIFTLWSSYMMMFYTDVFGVSPAFVGGLFLFSRIWDAINDPMMGVIADRTNTKWGRFRPWLLFTPIPIGICLILNFTVPRFTGTAAMIYATITYVLMSMAFTAVDIPYWSLPAAMTTDPMKRTKIYSYARLGTSLASTVASIIIIPLVRLFGGDNLAKGFFSTAVTFAIVGGALYFTSFSLVREHVVAESDKFKFKKAIKAFAQNKPLLITMIASLVTNSALLIKMNLQIYYVQYNLKSLDLMPIFAFVALPGIIIGTIIAPKLCQKFGKKYTLMGSNIFLLIVGVVFYFIGYSNIKLILFLSGLQTLQMGCSMVVLSAMTADTIEYAEFKTGQRNEGLIMSTQTFITKLGIAITGAISAGILTATNYIPNDVQTLSTLSTFHFVVTILPGIIGVFACIPLLFYDLTEEKHAQIVSEIEKRKVNNISGL